ncbi:MAG TPA: hypothetical protein VG345_16620 [Bryobacteraceae bacterium]|nr:hypothetical protein [Bryobacteraceae bacterium]
MSAAYVPVQKARLGLRGKKVVWYVAQLQLLTGQTGYSRVSVAPGFILMQLLGTATPGTDPGDGQGAFQVQIFDTARRQQFSDKPTLVNCMFGTGSDPFILKNPYRFTGTTPVNIRIQNRSKVTNQIWVVLYGVSD